MGDQISLRLLTMDDVSERYVQWLNDPLINQYLESRFALQTLDTVKDFVAAMISSDRDVLYGIFHDDEHVGNIKIGNIDKYHSHADIGLLIGSRRSRGIGTASISLATTIAFDELGLRKLTAGIYQPNVASHKAFLKNGYRTVGVLECHRRLGDQWVDQIVVEKVNLPLCSSETRPWTTLSYCSNGATIP